MSNIFPLSSSHQSTGQSPRDAREQEGAAYHSAARPQLRQLRPDEIRFNPRQTREIAGDAELEELARSISVHGVMQPILVRPLSGESEAYELVAGERRLRAAMSAGLHEVPALVQELDEQTAAERSVVENAQREDLNPVEEAMAFKRLNEEFGLSHQEISRVIGKSRAVVSNSLRLLNLPREVLDLLRSGELSAGHARLLLTLEDPKAQLRLARRTVRNALSVRALERLLEKGGAAGEDDDDDEELLRAQAALERQEGKLREYLNLEDVRLRYDAEGRRRLNIVFSSEAAWKRFLSKIR